MSPLALIAVILIVAIVLFVWNKVPAVVVAILVCLSLWASGLLSLNQALEGFGDPVVIFLVTLFVVTSALEVTGVIAWAGQCLINGAGQTSRFRLLFLTMSLVALLSALIGTSGAVAALLPVMVVTAVRLKRKSSQLLQPLAFAAHAGSMLALTGAPVNILVSDAAMDAGAAGFGLFEFALVGLPLLAGSMAIILLFGERLLPQKNGATIPADFSQHARTLVEHYGVADNLHRLRVRATSPFVSRDSSLIDLKGYEGIHVLAVHEGDNAQPIRRNIAENDHIIMRGHLDVVAKFATDWDLSFRAYKERSDDFLFNHQSGLAEVVIPPRSDLIGQSAFPGMVTESGDLVVLAIQRGSMTVGAGFAQEREGSLQLQAGDTMLLQGTWKALDVRLNDPDVLVVSSPELVRRQAVTMSADAKKAILVLILMIMLLATGIVPPAVAGMLAAGTIVLSGILTAEQAYRAIAWTTVILVAAMKPLATAMLGTGAAQVMSEQLLAIAGERSPTMLLACLFLVTAALGQFISSTAAALVVIPIGIAGAAGMGISPQPVLMCIGAASEAAFLTPVAAPANAMIMGPGGYTFRDYWPLGLPLLAWFFVVSVFYVPLIWSFS